MVVGIGGNRAVGRRLEVGKLAGWKVVGLGMRMNAIAICLLHSKRINRNTASYYYNFQLSNPTTSKRCQNHPTSIALVSNALLMALMALLVASGEFGVRSSPVLSQKKAVKVTWLPSKLS